MKLDLSKMANLLKGVENEKERERLSNAEEKYKYQDMFFDIMEWTDLKKADQYSPEEYQNLLERLPDYVEQIESDEMGVYGLGNMLSELQPVMTGRRRLL